MAIVRAGGPARRTTMTSTRTITSAPCAVRDATSWGRVTYQSMAETRPVSTEPVAAIMNNIPKVVFSRTLKSADWPESRIASGDTAEEIARLKAEPGGEIVAHGGARFVQSLARLGLVDE